ncbi:uncharacterized protein RCC_07074 [Ramularia collo-cygni]|uniref:Uncharacterized protein n=1 Tax=Ramularia collo-cygni TaxID=112498 RepID=A0A2D3UUC1_9PEZI|nr:uncharacterized protein RCC_07074 [Ramularia collo-cygni]CZT21212.1 uncharacterized protein RCC_07074 [Ramularia collo-cygni]
MEQLSGSQNESSSAGSHNNPSSLNPTIPHCLYLQQGMGGIYTFPTDFLDPQSTNLLHATAIGTTGCMSCVGVYIPIDDNRCFAAHIDASIYKPYERNMSVWQIPDNLGPSLRNVVRGMLESTFKGKEHEVKSIQQRQDLKDRAIIVCFWPTVGQQSGPGPHVIDTLCEYFHLDQKKLIGANAVHHGFIVDHFDKLSQRTRLLGWTRPGPSPQVLDEIAKLADNCTTRPWGDNFRSIFQTTYEYVMPSTLGCQRIGKEQEARPWVFGYDYSQGAWGVRE